MTLRGRFYRCNRNHSAYVLVVASDEPLNKMFNGALENLVKPGCAVRVAFAPPAGDSEDGIQPCKGQVGSAVYIEEI